MKILGIDASLTNTGICALQLDKYDGGELNYVIETFSPKTMGDTRLHDIYQFINRTCIANSVQLAVIEGYAFNPRFGQTYSIGEAGGVIKLRLFQQTIPLIVVAPQSLKKFATGIGKGKKNQMLMCAYKKYGIEFKNDHECDAYCLAQIGKIIWKMKHHKFDVKTLLKYEQEVIKTVCNSKSAEGFI